MRRVPLLLAMLTACSSATPPPAQSSDAALADAREVSVTDVSVADVTATDVTDAGAARDATDVTDVSDVSDARAVTDVADAGATDASPDVLDVLTDAARDALGDEGGDGAVAVGPYPAGPYGIARGDVLANLAWEGYTNPDGLRVSTMYPWGATSMQAIRETGRGYAMVHLSEFY